MLIIVISSLQGYGGSGYGGPNDRLGMNSGYGGTDGSYGDTGYYGNQGGGYGGPTGTDYGGGGDGLMGGYGGGGMMGDKSYMGTPNRKVGLSPLVCWRFIMRTFCQFVALHPSQHLWSFFGSSTQQWDVRA